MPGILAHDGPAARLLDRHGVTLETTQAATASKLADNDSTPLSDTTCLTANATFAMHRASMEARRRGTLDIAPMHLLLALLDSPDGSETLGLSSINITAVRDDARRRLDA